MIYHHWCLSNTAYHWRDQFLSKIRTTEVANMLYTHSIHPKIKQSAKTYQDRDHWNFNFVFHAGESVVFISNMKR